MQHWSTASSPRLLVEFDRTIAARNGKDHRAKVTRQKETWATTAVATTTFAKPEARTSNIEGKWARWRNNDRQRRHYVRTYVFTRQTLLPLSSPYIPADSKCSWLIAYKNLRLILRPHVVPVAIDQCSRYCTYLSMGDIGHVCRQYCTYLYTSCKSIKHVGDFCAHICIYVRVHSSRCVCAQLCTSCSTRYEILCTVCAIIVHISAQAFGQVMEFCRMCAHIFAHLCTSGMACPLCFKYIVIHTIVYMRAHA